MPARIRCSNAQCGHLFEDETIAAPKQGAAAEAPSELQEVVLICPFCEKPTKVKVDKSRVLPRQVHRQ